MRIKAAQRGDRMYDAAREPMPQLISRYRYEVLALVLAVLCAAVHVRADGASSVDPSQGGPVLRAIQLLEGRATDLKFKVRGERPPHPDVVVVAVDEKGAQKYGLWPWSRVVYAQGVERLIDAGAAAIGLDIEFTDPAQDDGAAFRELLSKVDGAGAAPEGAWAGVREELVRRAGTSPDVALEAALKKGGARIAQGVILYQQADLKDFSAEKAAEHAALIEPHLIRKLPGKTPGSFFEVTFEKIPSWSENYAAQTPLPALARTGGRLGHFSAVFDVDGTMRRTAPLAALMGPRGLLPSLAVQVAAIALNAEVVPVFEDDMLTGVTLKGKERTVKIPFQNNEPFTPINFQGPGERFSTLSLRDVIDGTFDPEQVKGKAVLVGVTLMGSSGDQRVTPFKQNEPGVYTHAAFLSNILSESFLSRPAGLVLIEALAMVLLALALARAIPRLGSFLYKGTLIAVMAAAWLAVDQALFAGGVQLATVLPLGCILSVSFGTIFLGYLSVDREKLAIRKTFTRYLGEDVMEEALKNPERLNRGEKREMTVLFSDIRGFTTLSERMLPDKLATFINEYLSPMTQIVFEEKGTLDKYIGDAIMAFWNAPLDQSDHALRACAAAIKMLAKLEELKVRWRKESYPEFDIGVGINTGTMSVGNMGSDVRVEYTVMGDAVNLASRLEGTNKEYETRVIMGEGTAEKVRGLVSARRLGAVRVKGKRKPVNIYELRAIGAPSGDDATAIASFEAALEHYAQQRWDEAEAGFKLTLSLWPHDAPARRYLEEIEILRKTPPGSAWDGVYTATTK